MAAHKSNIDKLERTFFNRIHDSLNTIILMKNTFKVVIVINIFFLNCKINCEDCNT